ncbi:PTS mannitol transporter subunit IICBA [Litorihabitans aurantiacus]|uniref:Mannitol-specific phosphotransferase enzyme IIA component n=1 Tax=Litorihabitans aurantiacus TaxID=1930061 RepID=A0AA38CU62_9MICO|nr:PTS mannitol transporter subunit IICBA [Litorihabitans aurantiacus]GMA31870.1 PTS mannose transporter subunit IIA [Litorihabitans aurantiacus]
MTTTTTPPQQRGGARVAVQKFGTFLSNMVMPNIAAFIAWGLLTALFIGPGWLNGATPETPDRPEFLGRFAPDSWVAQIGGWGDFADGGIVGPAITFLLPILIGYTGGYMLYKTRGGVVGAIATIGVVAGAGIPMFIGAMIAGPVGGWTIKKLDALWDGKIRPGFEMLVNNFSAGILGAILAFLGFFGIAPVVEWLTARLGDGVGFLVDNNILPATSILVEPAKVLFLNNAINHGVFTPLGSAESTETGRSLLFLIEANPGPGLGLLLAFAVAGVGVARASAPGAIIVQFLGGIHEIYFPYVLAKPRLILALILGGATGVLTNVIFGSGLVGPAAPGSIFAVLTMTAPGSHVGVILSVVASAGVTFLVAALILRLDKNKDLDLEAATAQMEANKGKKSSVASMLSSGAAVATGPIRSIVFACDAGMGSSAMGASVLRRKVQSAGLEGVTVVNKAISDLTDTYDLVVTHQDLTERARQRTGSAIHVSVDNFMNSPRYDEVVELVDERNNGGAPAGGSGSGSTSAAAVGGASSGGGVATATTTRDSVLDRESVVLAGSATTREAAIEEAGALLVAAGAASTAYVAAMHEREASVSTFMGEGLAIPHGTNEAKGEVSRTAVSFVRYANGIDWGGEQVKFVIAIAATGDEHLALLQQVAGAFLDAESVERLENAMTADEVKELLGA